MGSKVALSSELRSKIDSIIASDQVVLFMKGDRARPQCGFSAKVVDILDRLLPSYTTFDVLNDPIVREGIKEYASWPTIPQLYIAKEFIGGCDIITEMYQSSELQKTLGLDEVKAEAPVISISPSAALALKSALETADDDDCIRMSIDARFEHSLEFDTPKSNDVVVVHDGLQILFDPMSAKRAQGLSIDYAETPMGKGFKMNNPSAPIK